MGEMNSISTRPNIVRKKSHQTNLFFFFSFDMVTDILDRAEAVDALCLKFSEVSDNDSPDTTIVRKGKFG